MKKVSTEKAKVTTTYTIQAKLNLEVGIEVKAASLEAAVETAKTLKEEDFVTILGDYMDGDVQITGAWRMAE